MPDEQRGAALRSRKWFGGDDMPGFVHRDYLRAEGFTRQSLLIDRHHDYKIRKTGIQLNVIEERFTSR
jgi:hypothetical protein